VRGKKTAPKKRIGPPSQVGLFLFWLNSFSEMKRDWGPKPQALSPVLFLGVGIKGRIKKQNFSKVKTRGF